MQHSVSDACERNTQVEILPDPLSCILVGRQTHPAGDEKNAIGLLIRTCKPTEPRSYHVEMVRLKSGIAIQPERRRGSAA